MINEIFAFVDTNILLHFKPLVEIDWCTLLSAKSVTLVLCLPVIQELDHKKYDSRLGDRASRALKEIDEYDTAVKPLKPGVHLEIYNEELRHDEFRGSLSPDSPDDRIVHLVKKYKEAHVGRAVCVVAADFGIKKRCQAGR